MPETMALMRRSNEKIITRHPTRHRVCRKPGELARLKSGQGGLASERAISGSRGLWPQQGPASVIASNPGVGVPAPGLLRFARNDGCDAGRDLRSGKLAAINGAAMVEPCSEPLRLRVQPGALGDADGVGETVFHFGVGTGGRAGLVHLVVGQI